VESKWRPEESPKEVKQEDEKEKEAEAEAEDVSGFQP
jgi:hypothetical protein